MGNGNGFNAPTEAIDRTGQEVKGLTDKAHQDAIQKIEDNFKMGGAA